MSVLNRSVIDAVNKAYIQAFGDAMGQVRPIEWEGLGLVQRLEGKLGTGKTVNMAWMRKYVVMRRWEGERVYRDNEAFEFLVRNNVYEATIRTPITDLEDGLNVLSTETDAASLANAYQRRVNQDMHRLVKESFTSTNTLDGVPLFATNHPYGSFEFDASRPEGERWKFNQAGTYSNYTDNVFDETALWDARQAFIERKDFMGEPLGIMPDTLIIGPSKERLARTILTNSTKGDSNGGTVENESQAMFRYIVDPRLTGSQSEYWFLVASNAPRKPFVFWNRVAPTLQYQGFSGDLSANAASGEVPARVFDKDELIHGLRTRYGVAYGSGEYVYGSDGTGS